MGTVLRWRATRSPADEGFTLVEVLAAIVVLAIAFAALAAALVSGMVATSRASQNTEAKQIAAKQIESLHSVKWALLGLYQDEVGSAWGSGVHNGESVVKLASTTPSPRPADVPSPTKVVSGHSGKQYTVTTWVTWAGSSVASPNDGTTYAKKRLWVDVSYTPRGGSARTVHVEDYRAPTPLEMLPPADAPIIPITLANPVFTPSGQQLDASNKLVSAESILVDTTTVGTDVTAVVTQSDGTPITIALTGDATAKHWTGSIPAGSGPFSAGSLTVSFTAHNSQGVVATSTGTINLTAAGGGPAFAMTSPASNPVSQILNTDNTLAQAITVTVGTTTAASAVSLQWKLSDGTVSGLKAMTASGSSWTYTIPAGTGPFVPGAVLFTMTGTSTNGTTTASTTSTATLAATALGQIGIGAVTWTPKVCVKTSTNAMFTASTFTIEVKNIAATDAVNVSFQSLGFFPTASTNGTKGPNGGYLYTVTLASGTTITSSTFQFFVTAHRAADNTTSSPFYTSVDVFRKSSANGCPS
jgi:prepilin-type N-terminal cleavage/methylation domain-containing protein